MARESEAAETDRQRACGKGAVVRPQVQVEIRRRSGFFRFIGALIGILAQSEAGRTSQHQPGERNATDRPDVRGPCHSNVLQLLGRYTAGRCPFKANK